MWENSARKIEIEKKPYALDNTIYYDLLHPSLQIFETGEAYSLVRSIASLFLLIFTAFSLFMGKDFPNM